MNSIVENERITTRWLETRVPNGTRVNRWFCCTDRNWANNWWILIERYGCSFGCYYALSINLGLVGFIFDDSFANLTRIVDEYELKALSLSYLDWSIDLFSKFRKDLKEAVCFDQWFGNLFFSEQIFKSIWKKSNSWRWYIDRLLVLVCRFWQEFASDLNQF